MTDHPHRRRNLLNGRWVLVSPQRANRPWQGETSEPEPRGGPVHDPECHLCPGNTRSNGAVNPAYSGPFVFDNDFPVLLSESSDPPASDPVFAAAPATGAARVICYSPDHSLTMAEMDRPAVRALIDTWAAESQALHQRYVAVQVFENKGAMMGCSSPHPHGQIWAGDFVPSEVADEDREQAAWLAEHGTVLLDAVVLRELAAGERVIASNAHWLAVVPWWASWPFETMIVARDPVDRIEQLEAAARDSLALVLLQVTRAYDALFGVIFPYSMGWHQAPGTVRAASAWRLHAHFFPPLLRSATVRKFMVGYELLAEAQRDLTPETAAAQLREALVRSGTG